ncbi:MAG: helix-turn-helix transcriptional regulator [Ruminococcaceae bacterium]|nr:helix-turn-helix transcriptional regulator [Oscillospiraceae bacterium]
MSSDISVRFGKAIRTLRCKERISQEELAYRCGLHRTYVSDVELGKRNVSLENIDRISQALNITLADLFTEVDHIESVS